MIFIANRVYIYYLMLLLILFYDIHNSRVCLTLIIWKERPHLDTVLSVVAGSKNRQKRLVPEAFYDQAESFCDQAGPT